LEPTPSAVSLKVWLHGHLKVEKVLIVQSMSPVPVTIMTPFVPIIILRFSLIEVDLPPQPITVLI